MLYELKAILCKLESIDKQLYKNAFTDEEIQEKIDYVSDFPKLKNEIQNNVLSLQKVGISDTNTILRILYDLDATLGMCIKRIETVQNSIIQFISHFSDDELEGAG